MSPNCLDNYIIDMVQTVLLIQKCKYNKFLNCFCSIKPQVTFINRETIIETYEF